MKKFILILELLLAFSTSAQAEIYHGIDVDAIYNNSDWSSKDKIKEIIDDYTLLLQYQKEFEACSVEKPEVFDCYDKVAEKIINHFYAGNIDDNLNNYHNYIKATSSAYGIVYCLNKYNVPSETICNQENTANTWKFVERYINALLQSIEQILSKYSFIQNYKK